MEDQTTNKPADRLRFMIEIIVPIPDQSIQLDLFDPPPAEVVVQVRTGV